MAKKPDKDEVALPPDQRPLTAMQAERLAALTGIRPEELKGLTTAHVAERQRWKFDPDWFLFRRICGRVVKRDPLIGTLLPVPFATVHVEDTDCGFIWFSPPGSRWSWAWPLRCRREQIASVVTDACGRFCVWVPRWEIDWILRWRHDRVCVPEIFRRPTIADIIEQLRPHPPGPEPDPPPPWLLTRDGVALRHAEELLGRDVVQMLGTLETAIAPGASVARLEELLATPAFREPVPPPVDLGDAAERFGALAEPDAGVKHPQQIDVRRFVGPFRRCWDVFAPEWQRIVDVPDITFRVTQDVDGDGTEETIYSEGFFDVRWDAGPIPDVTLVASEIARAALSCDAPGVPCGDAPKIVMAGFMPLDAAYFDAASGYATRPNRPHPSGSYGGPSSPTGEAPFCDDVHLRGCNRYAGAKYYRLVYSYGAQGPTPFTATWQQFRWIGHLDILNVVPDANGWYEILNPADGWMDPNLLLNWRTGLFSDGVYDIKMQLADAAKNVIAAPGASTSLKAVVDNSRPVLQMDVAWRTAPTGGFVPLPAVCPVVTRPANAAVELMVTFQASAKHLRSVELAAGGCGGGGPVLTSAVLPQWEQTPPLPATAAGMRHWHTAPSDNSVAATAAFRLDPAAPQGVYSFSLWCYSRAFNPAGADAGDELFWNYDPVYRWSYRFITFAVVNA